MFYKRSDVATVSIHSNPEYDYPNYTGLEDEIGYGDGKGYNLNICMPPKATYNQHYKPALIKALRWLQDNVCNEYNDSALVIAFGADTYELDEDPSNTAGMKLTDNDYTSIGQVIRQYLSNTPIMITQEGGYYLPAVPTCAANLLIGLTGQ